MLTFGVVRRKSSRLSYQLYEVDDNPGFSKAAAEDMSYNDIVKSSLLKIKGQIIQGSQIATAMSAAKFFPKS